jgi:hypothetical protein
MTTIAHSHSFLEHRPKIEEKKKEEEEEEEEGDDDDDNGT